MTSEIKVKVKTLEKQIENGSNLESSAALLMELKVSTQNKRRFSRRRVSSKYLQELIK